MCAHDIRLSSRRTCAVYYIYAWYMCSKLGYEVYVRSDVCAIRRVKWDFCTRCTRRRLVRELCRFAGAGRDGYAIASPMRLQHYIWRRCDVRLHVHCSHIHTHGHAHMGKFASAQGTDRQTDMLPANAATTSRNSHSQKSQDKSTLFTLAAPAEYDDIVGDFSHGEAVGFIR